MQLPINIEKILNIDFIFKFIIYQMLSYILLYQIYNKINKYIYINIIKKLIFYLFHILFNENLIFLLFNFFK